MLDSSIEASFRSLEHIDNRVQLYERWPRLCLAQAKPRSSPPYKCQADWIHRCGRSSDRQEDLRPDSV